VNSLNRDVLVRLARLLGPLADALVFVGGRVADLLVTDPVGLRVRPTDDTDCVCEAATRVAYHRLGERLRALGFVEDTTPGAPICRWRAADELLDVMPVEGTVLGFGNVWFAHAIRLSERVELEPGVSIRVVAAPVFLATKWEAHNDRGGAAWYGDADIEDVVRVVAGRPSIEGELVATERDIRAFVAAEARRFLNSGVTEDVIAGALPDARDAPGLLDRVGRRFEVIARSAS
jgi:hypothetical protein